MAKRAATTKTAAPKALKAPVSKVAAPKAPATKIAAPKTPATKIAAPKAVAAKITAPTATFVQSSGSATKVSIPVATKTTFKPVPMPVTSVVSGVAASAAAAIALAKHTAEPPLAWDPATHLLSRFAFGADTASRSSVAQVGPDAWWAAQVALGTSVIGYSGNRTVAAQGPLLAMSPSQVVTWLQANSYPFAWDAMYQLSNVTLGLQCWSGAQLYESLVQFFGDHLNVANHNQDLWNTRHTMDRDVVRKYAFGTFSDMLVASGRNPAMLRYLSLYQSNKAAVNENYGRELMELHTLGVGNYTEADVTNSARILTGRTIDSGYEYTYNPAAHWVGKVTVRTFTDANATAAGGEELGDRYLRYLAIQPETATHLARKLCIRYVSDNPSNQLVAAVAQVYLKNNTAILPTVHAIFCSPEFWAARGAKIRRPAENVVAAVRALGLMPVDVPRILTNLRTWSGQVGQVPLARPTPDGYPDVAAAWRSSSGLLSLWAIHRLLVSNTVGAGTFDPTKLYGTTVPATSGQALDLLTSRLTQTVFSTTDRNYLLAYLNEPATTPMAKSNLRSNILNVVAMILDGPHHAYR